MMNYNPAAQFQVKEWDVEFRRTPKRTLMARIYQPQGTGPFPTVLDLHGGVADRCLRFSYGVLIGAHRIGRLDCLVRFGLLAVAGEPGLPRRLRLGRHGLLPYQLDDRHRGVVALARHGLDDPRVTTSPVREERTDLGDQAVHDLLVPDHPHDHAAIVQITALGFGDQTLGERPKPPRLRLGCMDLAVLEQRGGQVGQYQPFVGRRPAETGTLGWGGHE